MNNSMSEVSRGRWCRRADALLGVDGVHVNAVTATASGLLLHVETGDDLTGCPECGVVAVGQGRRQVRLHDDPCFGRAVGWATDALRGFDTSASALARQLVHARLLDLDSGRSGRAYVGWLKDPGPGFTAVVKTGALDPFRSYANAIRDELPEAITVLDAFHVVKLGSAMVDGDCPRSSRTPSGTVAAKEIRSTESAGPCRSETDTSPTSSPPGSTRNSWPETRTMKSPWSGSAIRSSATSIKPGLSGAGRS